MVANKTLALFIIAAVVVSLGGTLLSLNKIDELHKLRSKPDAAKQVTGMASGKVELTIDSMAGCIVDSNVSFGSGNAQDIILSTDLDNSPSGFNDCSNGASAGCRGLQINNTGNEEIYVNFTSDNTAILSFPGGPSAIASDFRYAIRNGTYAGTYEGCRNITGLIVGTGTWATINTSNNQICRNLTPSDLNDIMTMEFNVTLKPDTPAGAKTAIITVDCIDLQ